MTEFNSHRAILESRETNHRGAESTEVTSELLSFKFFARRANLLVEPRITLMARMGMALSIRAIRAIRGLISRMLACLPSCGCGSAAVRGPSAMRVSSLDRSVLPNLRISNFPFQAFSLCPRWLCGEISSDEPRSAESTEGTSELLSIQILRAAGKFASRTTDNTDGTDGDGPVYPCNPCDPWFDFQDAGAPAFLWLRLCRAAVEHRG